jgi:FixJ family two-component response regulator
MELADEAPNGGVRHRVSVSGVVDDDEAVRDALSSLIRSAGYQCRLFPSAEAFLESNGLVETDCILLDVQMPGLSGIELQARLRRMNCPVPVIFVTAHADDSTRAKALGDGAKAFLAKPVSDDVLLTTIGSALNGG